MKKESKFNSINNSQGYKNSLQDLLKKSLDETREDLKNLSAPELLMWGHEQFAENFVLTTSFGIQSAVLLHMTGIFESRKKPKVIWIDTGYLPKETYIYADQLTKILKIDLVINQSNISPARMEALYGRLWEKGSHEDLEKYHQIRKVEPLENALSRKDIKCWGSGVRKGQTTNRKSMNLIDFIRGRLSLRPLLNWSKKDIFYYMEENNLPQHPLFEKGYSTVGDWHSSQAENVNNKGRSTRFGGVSEECGIHINQEIS